MGTADDREADSDDNEGGNEDDEDAVHPIRIIPSHNIDIKDEFQPFPHVKCKSPRYLSNGSRNGPKS